MPNTPVAVGEGMSVIALGEYAGEANGELVLTIFSAVGKAIMMNESAMDAVTGLSGSGPGYVFVMIDALADAGVRAGLSRENSLVMAAQTLLGASKMVLETGEHPAKLRDMVTSPGGTTIAGIHVLEQRGVRAALIDAVQAATQRSQEMGKKASSEREKILRYYKASGEGELAARLLDLAENAQRNRKYKVSEFLDPHGYSIAETIGAHYNNLKIVSNGGYSGAERVKTIFVNEEFRGIPDLNVEALSVTWDERYYQLTHRDVLGALMGLGIKREIVGDIIMCGHGCQILIDASLVDFVSNDFKMIGAATCNVIHAQVCQILYLARKKLKKLGRRSLHFG